MVAPRGRGGGEALDDRRTVLSRFRPAAPRRVLLLLAAILWTAVGVMLRHSHLHRAVLAYVYLSIGGALFLASFLYYRLLARQRP